MVVHINGQSLTRIGSRKIGRELENSVEVHTVALTKYNLEVSSVSSASKLEQWAFLLLFAQDYDVPTLRRLVPGCEFETAIAAIQTISEKTEDKQMYDQREKAQRDYEWALTGARSEGREEGEHIGLLKGKILTLREVLGEASPDEEESIEGLSIETLEIQLADLRRRLHERQA